MGVISRRRLLATMGVAAGAAVGAGGVELLHASRPDPSSAPPTAVPFTGTHQAGIITPPRTTCALPPST